MSLFLGSGLETPAADVRVRNTITSLFVYSRRLLEQKSRLREVCLHNGGVKRRLGFTSASYGSQKLNVADTDFMFVCRSGYHCAPVARFFGGTM